MLSVILLYMLMILLSTLRVIRHLIFVKNCLLNLNLIYETLDWERKWFVDFNAGKTPLVSFDQSSNTGAIYVKMDGSFLEEKISFKMLGLTFCSILECGFYIMSIAKSAYEKIGTLICSMKFLSPEVALFVYKSTKWPYVEY